MRTSSLIAALFASSILTTGAFAQDAPAVDDPEIRLDAGKTDTDAPRVDLGTGAGGVDLPDVNPAAGSGSTKPPAAGGRAAPVIPESIKKMTDEEKQKLGSLLSDASAYLAGIRVQEAFEKLVEAELMAPDYAAVHNLIGAAHTKTRDFDKAAASFARAVELNPAAFMSKFNLTEIHFVQGKWDLAEKEFQSLLAEDEKMDPSTRSLIEFKILICKLKQADEAGAKEVLSGFDYLDDHPGFYYGNAAVHFNKDEEAEARKWLKSAERIYPKAQLDIYTVSFVEVGWIENLQ